MPLEPDNLAAFLIRAWFSDPGLKLDPDYRGIRSNLVHQFYPDIRSDPDYRACQVEIES